MAQDMHAVFLSSGGKQRIMDWRILTAACIIVLLIILPGLLLTRPISATWVCTDRLTEHSMLSDEVTALTLRPDGSADFRSYATFLIGRYQIRDGSGHWEPAGFGNYRVTITQGIDSSCSHYQNCTLAALAPFGFTVDHDILRDTIAYHPNAAPEFTMIRPFVRSIITDCSNGCPG